MYRYRFSAVREDQAIVQTMMTDSQKDGFQIWQLRQHQDEYFLCLGEEVSWAELVDGRVALVAPKYICQLCSEQTVAMIHRMVYERYTGYRDVIPLFFGSDIDLLLKHRPHTSLKHKKWQTLTIFPTLLATMQHQSEAIRDEDTTVVLSGDATSVQRAKAYRAIQSGKVHTLWVTHSQIFWDRGQLTSIEVIDEHSPFYQVYQEPRYNILACVQKMREIYEIDG